MGEVQRATAEDTDDVLAFYYRVIDDMQGTDFDVLWKKDIHPTDDEIRDAIAQGNLYVLREAVPETADFGSIAAALIMNNVEAPGYENVAWEVQAKPGEYQVLHVVATLAALHGQGLGSRLIQGVIEQARIAGLKAIRLDTFVHNKRGKGLYEKQGFYAVGDYDVFYPDLGTVTLSMYEYALGKSPVTFRKPV